MDVEDKQGNTALHIAARHGHASVTKTLIMNGADVQMLRRGSGGMLPVHMACLSGYSDCVELLIPVSKYECGRGRQWVQSEVWSHGLPQWVL